MNYYRNFTMKYQRNPKFVDAILWDGTNFDKIKGWLGDKANMNGAILGIKTVANLNPEWVPKGFYIVKYEEQLYTLSKKLFEERYSPCVDY